MLVLVVVVVILLVAWNGLQFYSLSQVQVNYNSYSLSVPAAATAPTGVNLSIILQISNPSALPIVVPDLNYTVYLGGQTLTSGHRNGGEAVNAASSTLIAVSAMLGLSQLTPALINVLTQYLQAHTATLRITGTAYPHIAAVPLLPFFYTFPVPFDITRTL